jgi:small GTP-binding protein
MTEFQNINNEEEKEKENSLTNINQNIKNPYKPDKKYKIILIGNTGVGKTSLIVKALRNQYIENNQSTLGFEYYNILTEIDSKKILLRTWDTCGQEIFKSIISTFYKRANLAILVYAINDLESFYNINFWLNEIKSHASSNIKLILIGNKIDLNSNRKVTFEEGKNFSIENKFDLFLETSAKEGFNAKEFLFNSAKILYEDDLEKEKKGIKNDESENNLFSLNYEQETKENEGRSCDNCF